MKKIQTRQPHLFVVFCVVSIVVFLMTMPSFASDTREEENLPRWSLDDLYQGASDPRIQWEIKAVLEDIEAFSKAYRGRVKDLDPGQLLASIKKYEDIHERVARLTIFHELSFYARQHDPLTLKQRQHIEETFQEPQKKLTFFELEIAHMPPESLEKALSSSAGLRAYAYWLERVQKQRPHLLSEDLENLMGDFSLPASTAWRMLAQTMTSHIKIRMGEQELTLAEVSPFMQDPDERKRKAAFEATALALKGQGEIFTHVYNAILQSHNIRLEWSKFKNPDDMRHLRNGIERKDVEALVKTSQEAYSRIATRYYALKAKWLGKVKLDVWDRAAPLFRGKMRALFHGKKQKILSWLLTTDSPQKWQK